eukprot:TRINITY_DN18953_c0_g1_i1.p1 TRINITY_DN18953_c0_g1~~TRINITY_DN18953_c0_g1_i1.p1  ORF type:complete len:243 (-),score=75.53 TRINITY_DN18953_c0_g1_i1:149-877(-)
MSTQFSQFNAFNRPFNAKAVFSTADISPRTKAHLVNVYSLLASTLAAAAAGVYADGVMRIGGLLTGLMTLGCVIYLHGVPNVAENHFKRTMILLGAGFFKGASIGPLVNAFLRYNPDLVLTAFMLTTVIFVCFTGAAYFAERRSYLFLGGMLGSALSMMFFLSLFNMFFRSTAVFNVQLYVGLLVFCGYVIYDTQLIIEKSEMGLDDAHTAAVELFIDFVAIFIRILIILNKRQEEKKRRRD